MLGLRRLGGCLAGSFRSRCGSCCSLWCRSCNGGRSFRNDLAGGSSSPHIRYPDSNLLSGFSSTNKNYESLDSRDAFASLAAVNDPYLVFFAKLDWLTTRFCPFSGFFFSPAPSRLVTFGTLISIETTTLATVPVAQTNFPTLPKMIVSRCYCLSVFG